MDSIYLKFVQHLKRNSIKIGNQDLCQVINKFHFELIKDDKNNATRFSEKQDEGGIIIVDKYIENRNEIKYGDDFIIICFDYSFYIFQNKLLNYIIQFLEKSKNSTIFCYSDQIIIDLKKKNINFHFSQSDSFFRKIPKFLDNFSFEMTSSSISDQYEFSTFNNLIFRKSALGFLLMKSYQNSRIDRSNQLYDFYHPRKDIFRTNENEYIKLKYLGKGSSAKAYLIYHVKKECIYTLKIFIDPTDDKTYQRELENYQNLSHPYFPIFYGTSLDKSLKCLVIEYIEKKHQISKSNIFQSTKFLLKYLKIMKYIHDNKYIYRDHRNDNFIITRDDQIYIIDFDRMIKESLSKTETPSTTNFQNIPPEGKYSYQSDVYYIGDNIINYFFPESLLKEYPEINEKWKEIIDRCLNDKPESRPTITELIDNTYLLLGHLYEEGINTMNNYLKAKKCYEKAIESNNNSEALYRLGCLNESGFLGKPDYYQAIYYYQLSANENNPKALNSLGSLYLIGNGVEKDYTKAKEYFELSEKQGYSKALNNLGHLYLNGLGVDKDVQKAINYYEKSAKLNDSEALLKLGNIYYNGKNVPRDILRAKAYYEKAKSNSKALFNLANIYWTQFKNIEEAIKYFKQSAELHNTKAINKLGDIYFTHEDKKDYEEAKKYFEMSEQLNNPFGIYYLGLIYLNGYGVQPDINKAMYYFVKSSILNNPDAFHVIGYLYSNGCFIEYNIQKAKDNYLKTIEKGKNINITTYNPATRSFENNPKINIYYYHSLNDLGLINLLYDNDLESAFENIKNAAFGEYPFAQNNQGLILQLYRKDIQKAEYFYERSSSKKFALAQANLGFIKESEGKVEESIVFFKKASHNENKPLTFRMYNYTDCRLNESKKIIILLVNLKLVYYYLSKSDNTNAHKYYIRCISKCQIKKSLSFFTDNNLCELIAIINNSTFISKLQAKYNNNQLVIFQDDFENFVDRMDFLFNFQEKVFQNAIKKLKKIFIQDIKNIINILEKILNTPPYHILFGRIHIVELKKSSNNLKNIKDINNLFYEGFEEII